MDETLNLEHYEGKPHTFIKHALLKAYLKRLFMIIGQSERTIRYVDCFAGPWQEESDDLETTSIAISLKIMKECREGLLQRGKDVCFKALYIEKKKSAFDRLKSFLGDYTSGDVTAQPLHGEFFPLRDEILKWCSADDFTFFFIDPTGWKNVVEIDTLNPLLKRKRSEFLINFMFDFVLRAHSQELFQKHMIDIFGRVPNTEGMDPKQREDYLLKTYLGELKKSLISTDQGARLAYVKIKDPKKDRTKYDLVYLTRHPLGIIVFMEESEKLDLIQKKVRAHTRQENRIHKSGQGELFPAHQMLPDDEDVDLCSVKDYWLSKLSDEPKRFGREELADMLEETGWFESDFQRAFNELLSEKKVVNHNAHKKRPVKAVHFLDGEYLKQVKQ